MNSCLFGLSGLLTAFILTFPATAAPQKAYGKIEVLRDTWGIPHVYSETDPGAMYGLGYATAQEHGFQMTYSLRIIQGRLAELLGERSRTGREETAVDHDRRMRTFGWERAARRTAANLDSETRRLLRAYCEGVNDSFEAQKRDRTLHPLFEKYGIDPEPWTPADCLLSWWHLAQFFATDGTRELMTWRNKLNPPRGMPLPPEDGKLWADDSTAVVRLENADQEWVKEVESYQRQHGLARSDAGEVGPKFSHAWVVGGSRTTTGAAVLVSDPQTPVRNPSLWIEFHVSGKTFNARGIGVPGSPGLLLGFNPHIAWGLTALGADQADLFLLETSAEHPDAYLWEGNWRKMEVRTERIKVKGGSEVELKVRETHLGPVVSAFASRQPDDPEVALKRVPLCESNQDTIQAVFAMIRAQSAAQLADAFPAWRFPTANCVYGDSKGHIGYSVLGAIPIRSSLESSDRQGRYATKATKPEHDWEGFLPHSLVPQVTDPKNGILLSGNHRPVASFYNIPLGLSTGSMGDTIRSWRLRERLSREGDFTPQQVLDVHYDTVNPARRDMVRIGLHVRDSKQSPLSDDSLKALEVLEKWLRDGASSDLRKPGADLATRLSTFFRFVATPLAIKYGGGESGLARYLKDAIARIEADKAAVLSKDEQQYIDTTLTSAWSGQDGQRGSSNSRPQARQSGPNRPVLGWFETLDGFGSLDRSQDLPSAPINVLDGQTIHSQAGQSYTHYVPLHDVDSAQTICPIGHSDRPDSPYRTSTMTLWGEAKLHPAPLSRSAVEKITKRSLVLSE